MIEPIITAFEVIVNGKYIDIRFNCILFLKNIIVSKHKLIYISGAMHEIIEVGPNVCILIN